VPDAPEEYDFQFPKTKVLVTLRRQDHVSRTEARPLFANLQFREIVLDVRDEQSVGLGFADEVLRSSSACTRQSPSGPSTRLRSSTP